MAASPCGSSGIWMRMLKRASRRLDLRPAWSLVLCSFHYIFCLLQLREPVAELRRAGAANPVLEPTWQSVPTP